MQRKRWEWGLCGLSIAVYFAVRLIGLDQFPIYFFTDEAVHTVRAEQLVQNHFRGDVGELLPTYFKNGSVYNLSLSVYTHIIPWLIWGKSIWATRGVSVFISLLFPLSVALIMRIVFRSRWWWAAVLLVSLIPAWFLHSRTAFEVVLFVSWYAVAVLGYLMYRCVNPRWLFFAIIASALAFYSYSPGQVVVGVTALLLGLVDFRYHWRNPKILVGGMMLSLLVFIPYARFTAMHHLAARDHLRALSSYWVQPVTTQEKVAQLRREYAGGLHPTFWFFNQPPELVRHVMKGWGHLGYLWLPLLLVGFLSVGRAFRQAAYRTIVIILLATPVGGAMVAVGITRNLVTLVPLAIIGCLGLHFCLEWLRRLSHHKWRFDVLVSGSLLVVLIAINGLMLWVALTKAATWYDDYGLYGMQWGAKEVFGAVETFAHDNPDVELVVTPTWSNGTDELLAYFLSKTDQVNLGSVVGHIKEQKPLTANHVFVVTAEEMAHLQQSQKFQPARIEKMIPYPNGEPGFYFVRLAYIDGIEAVFAAEKEARKILVEKEVRINGEAARVWHSREDMGTIQMVFDDNPLTLMRGYEANPLIIEAEWPKVQQARGMKINTGSSQIQLTVWLWLNKESDPHVYETTYAGSITQPEQTLEWGDTSPFTKVRWEIKDPHTPEPTHIHVWNLELY